MLYLLIGASIAFQHPDSRFFDDARQVRPSVLYCIPNDFTKLFAVYKLSLSSWSFRSQIAFDYIFKLKDICSNEKFRDTYFKKRLCDAVVKVVDFLIFSRISEQVGGKLRMIFVCSSGLAPACMLISLFLVFIFFFTFSSSVSLNF